uniref:TRP C-terminal domain-containing protein n=1 Tax=Bionectria ochroleuca TaxID=29856 RepID=A0A8H7TSR6_BIOOC
MCGSRLLQRKDCRLVGGQVGDRHHRWPWTDFLRYCLGSRPLQHCFPHCRQLSVSFRLLPRPGHRRSDGRSPPPVVQSWTQNFQWSMGIINVGFMQTIFTWYQRATGGDPGTLFDNLGTKSVQVEKRALALRSIGSGSESVGLFNRAAAMMPRSLPTYSSLAKRANIVTESGGYLVYGIQRVAYRSKIESTNLFLTGLVFFILFVVFTILIVAAFKGILELCAKRKWISGEKFAEFRNGWLTILKGILFRATLIGFPQMCILCTWEFTQKDSPALVVLAVFFLLGMIGTLGWGSFKVISIARRSVTMHRNPAYILFSDPRL